MIDRRTLLISSAASLAASAGRSAPTLSYTHVSFQDLAPGEQIKLVLNNKPVLLRHRTNAEIAAARDVPLDTLPHPQDRIPDTNFFRDARDENRALGDNGQYLLVSLICPRLGCVVLTDVGDFDGFFCPCGGSHFDTSGRFRKGVAPANLEIPIAWLEGRTIVIASPHHLTRDKALRDTLGWE